MKRSLSNPTPRSSAKHQHTETAPFEIDHLFDHMRRFWQPESLNAMRLVCKGWNRRPPWAKESVGADVEALAFIHCFAWADTRKSAQSFFHKETWSNQSRHNPIRAGILKDRLLGALAKNHINGGRRATQFFSYENYTVYLWEEKAMRLALSEGNLPMARVILEGKPTAKNTHCFTPRDGATVRWMFAHMTIYGEYERDLWLRVAETADDDMAFSMKELVKHEINPYWWMSSKSESFIRRWASKSILESGLPFVARAPAWHTETAALLLGPPASPKIRVQWLFLALGRRGDYVPWTRYLDRYMADADLPEVLERILSWGNPEGTDYVVGRFGNVLPLPTTSWDTMSHKMNHGVRTKVIDQCIRHSASPLSDPAVLKMVLKRCPDSAYDHFSRFGRSSFPVTILDAMVHSLNDESKPLLVMLLLNKFRLQPEAPLAGRRRQKNDDGQEDMVLEAQIQLRQSRRDWIAEHRFTDK